MSIKDISEKTGIKEANIRRILGQGAKSGDFKRLARGVYSIETKDGVHGIVKMVDALKEIKKVDTKFDMVFLDIPYRTKAVIGGSRGVKYDLISPTQFEEFLGDLKKNLKNENTPICYMFSNAPSGRKEMEMYTKSFDTLGFKKIGSGSWTKLFGNGNLATNMRGEKMPPEGISIYSLSGDDDFFPTMSMDYVLPKTRVASQKPYELLRGIITNYTNMFGKVLDPFSGSGIVGKVCIDVKRNFELWELSGERFYNEIIF